GEGGRRAEVGGVGEVDQEFGGATVSQLGVHRWVDQRRRLGAGPACAVAASPAAANTAVLAAAARYRAVRRVVASGTGAMIMGASMGVGPHRPVSVGESWIADDYY